MFVKPRDGMIVRDPVSYQPLPATGAYVSDDLYWARRVRDGDVIEAPEPVDAPAAPPMAEAAVPEAQAQE